MARLEYALSDLKAEGHEPATKVALAGSVDPDTLSIFEEMMDTMIEQGRCRVIFDMSNLKYINSTGMGMSVQFADQLGEENGGLVFMKVPPKVLLVIEMLGLQELFQIVSTEEQALAALAGGDVGPASIEVKLEEETPSDLPEVITVEDTIDPIEEDEVFSDTGGEKLVLPCPTCAAKLSVSGAGNYRCPRCRSLSTVDDNGQILSYPEQAGHIAELSIPGDPDYLAGVSWMVNMSGLKAGLSEGGSQAAAQAAEGCLQLLARESINGSGDHDRLHVFIRACEKHLSVRVYCAGNALPDRAAVAPYRSLVDRLDYMVSAEGNLISIDKSE